jgi:Holliday junction resolvasome RuvABC endonuclease subunit
VRVLGIDGGAERLGWGIVEKTPSRPVYIDSGLAKFPRADAVFQSYRVNLLEAYVRALTGPGSIFDPSYLKIDAVVNETVPAVGSYGGTQMYLVNVAVTAVQTLAIERDIPVYQISATSVHKSIVEVFVILLDNAIKYSPKKSEVSVVVHKNQKQVVIAIKDNGIGIAEKDKVKIFERFYRADSSRTVTDGYGLGLSIARKTIEKHNGSIQVTSTLNKGSLFEVKFPRIA